MRRAEESGQHLLHEQHSAVPVPCARAEEEPGRLSNTGRPRRLPQTHSGHQAALWGAHGHRSNLTALVPSILIASAALLINLAPFQ